MGTVRTFSGDTRRTIWSLFQYIIKRIGIAYTYSRALLQDAVNIPDMTPFQRMVIGCHSANLIVHNFCCFPFIGICRDFRQYRCGCMVDFLLHYWDIGHFTVVFKINHTAKRIICPSSGGMEWIRSTTPETQKQLTSRSDQSNRTLFFT